MSGLYAGEGGTIIADGAISIGNGGHGFHAAPGGKIIAPNSVSVGNEGDGYRAENGATIDLGQVQTQVVQQPINKKLWYEKPIGKIAITLFVAVVGGGLIHFLGWS